MFISKSFQVRHTRALFSLYFWSHATFFRATCTTAGLISIHSYSVSHTIELSSSCRSDLALACFSQVLLFLLWCHAYIGQGDDKVQKLENTSVTPEVYKFIDTLQISVQTDYPEQNTLHSLLETQFRIKVLYSNTQCFFFSASWNCDFKSWDLTSMCNSILHLNEHRTGEPTGFCL